MSAISPSSKAHDVLGLGRSTWNWLSALFLIALVLVAYARVFGAGFIWDDDEYVTKNALLVAPDGLWRIWFSLDSPSQYFPLVYTTFRIERALWGLDPTGYHWVNVLLHAANALLVWRLLARLKIPGAYLAAMIFALHPVQVESVAWITERKNVLMGFFFLLSLLAWIAFEDGTRTKRWIFYALALVAYMMALSAKTTACVLPAVMLLILWLQRKPINGRRIIQIVPFILLGVGMGLVTVWWERFHQGTRGAMFSLSLLERALVATRAVWFYLSKLIWPSDLTFIYPQWKISISDPLAYAGLAAGIGLCVAIYFFRRWTGRGVEVAAAFFVATLSPLLGFIMLYTFRYTYVADHYQYLASLGPIALVSAGIVKLGEAIDYRRQTVAVTGILIVALLGTLTWRQSASYSDIETLWRTTIAKNPACWMAYNNLGIALFEKGDTDEAIVQYEKSLQFHSNYAQTHYNLAIALLEKGKIDQAIAQCRQALALQSNEPDAHVAFGNALLAKGSIEQAINEYLSALQLSPNNANAHYNLGNALLKKGETAAAMSEFENAVQFDPDLVEAHMQLADALARQGSWSDAIAHYDRALQSLPHSADACNNLAWILASCPDKSLRDGSKAVRLAEKAREMSNGENPIILHTLAAAYAQDRQFVEATRIAQEALELAIRAGDSALVEDLRREIEIYRGGSAYPASSL